MSVDVLRAHYGMIGGKPERAIAPQPFEIAFAAALPTKSPPELQSLCPLLVINPWDGPELVRATPDKWRGRLRFIGAVAMFYLDFDPSGMVWPETTRHRLDQLERALRNFDMARDPVNGEEEHPPGSERPGFLQPHKIAVDMNLRVFWERWMETRHAIAN